MLNIIWPLFIIVSFIYAFLTGNIFQVNTSIFNSTTDAINLSINLLGTICLWNGIMNIATNTKLIDNLTNKLKPILKKLFPEIKENSQIQSEISMNIIANILGLGNAATPIGLKAMESMQKENNDKDKLSNSMVMFIVLNTASLQLIPTTVIAIRNSMGSSNPTQVIFPVWIATIVAAIVGVTVTKLFIKFNKYKEKR